MLSFVVMTGLMTLVRSSEEYLDWKTVIQDDYIPYDVESFPLQIKADTAIFNTTKVLISFVTSYQGFFVPDTLEISLRHENLYYDIDCSNWTNKSMITTKIPEKDTIQLILKKTSTSLVGFCNGVKIIDFVYGEHGENCVDFWTQNIAWIRFKPIAGMQFRPHRRELEENCSLAEVGKSEQHFLKQVCYYDNLPWYKCPHSDQYYGVIQDYGSDCSFQRYDHACNQDINFYQACGHNGCHNYQQGPMQHGEDSLLCSTYICTSNRAVSTNFGSLGGNLITTRNDCDGVLNCINTDMDEDNHCKTQQTFTCQDKFEMETQIELSRVCNNECDCALCSDEGNCNNMTYGVWCDSQSEGFIHSRWVCDSEEDCSQGEDESDQICSENSTVRICNFRDVVKPLTKLHICAVPIAGTKLCSDGMDQVNCSDSSRVALQCQVNGYTTTISMFALCKGFALCDDKYDDQCEQAAPDCFLHTNLFCDGVADCPGEEDESDDFCTKISNVTCTRRVYTAQERIQLPIRLLWVFNGVNDCIQMEDESDDYWHKCGHEKTARMVEEGTPCQEVFKCPLQDIYIHFPSLCDKVAYECGLENEICEKARNHISLTKANPRYDGPQIALSYCLRGLESVHNQAGSCLYNFEFMINGSDAFGATQFLMDMPKQPSTCMALSGKAYVFRSCSDLCSDAQCSLSEVPDSCLNVASYRTFSLTPNNELVPLIKKKGQYFFQTFSCDNGRCVEFDKVCNFVDDCGDASDERACKNSFYCPGHKEFIPISSKCDGHVDCQDYFDECNSDCPSQQQQILGDFTVKIICWIVGILAVVSNSVTVIRSAIDLKTAKLYREALTRTMILLISSGDLLMGLYLLAIAVVDYTYRNTYCSQQYLWLTSSTCAALGVINTVASQMSLFAMTALSMFRALTVRSRSMVKEGAATASARIRLIAVFSAITLTSLVIGYGPLVKSFEDNFVNGLYYDKNPLFTASISKDIHHDIFKVYYGRYKSKVMTWERIRHLTGEMFTSEYGGIRGRTIHFFGNEAVCVFKYFVTEIDPQRYFSLTILLTNFTCFLVICFSYIIIGKEANSGSSNVRARKHKRNLQIKIGLIILTDFLCWIPFIVVCFLHYSELIDATSWYTNFSIIILPINSIINPLLYNSIFQEFTEDLYIRVSSVTFVKRMSNLPARRLKTRLNHPMVPLPEETEEGEVGEEEKMELLEQS